MAPPLAVCVHLRTFSSLITLLLSCLLPHCSPESYADTHCFQTSHLHPSIHLLTLSLCSPWADILPSIPIPCCAQLGVEGRSESRQPASSAYFTHNSHNNPFHVIWLTELSFLPSGMCRTCSESEIQL